MILAIKFPFQQYIVAWGKICRSKIIGGGAAPSHLRLLFSKIVYINLRRISERQKNKYFCSCVTTWELNHHSSILQFIKATIIRCNLSARFYSNSLVHILSLSNSHNNVASIQKNQSDKSHRVIVA